LKFLAAGWRAFQRRYSPGDTWELYVGPDGRIEEMAYHAGGPPKLEWPHNYVEGAATNGRERLDSAPITEVFPSPAAD
jgi:hypothetical protein